MLMKSLFIRFINDKASVSTLVIYLSILFEDNFYITSFSDFHFIFNSLHSTILKFGVGQ
jgi:hypothetical protein